MSEHSPAAASEAPETGSDLKCDFCHQIVPSVRRVALHGDYERLRTPHAVLYSCPNCFEKKERVRLGLDRS